MGSGMTMNVSRSMSSVPSSYQVCRHARRVAGLEKPNSRSCARRSAGMSPAGPRLHAMQHTAAAVCHLPAVEPACRQLHSKPARSTTAPCLQRQDLEVELVNVDHRAGIPCKCYCVIKLFKGAVQLCQLASCAAKRMHILSGGDCMLSLLQDHTSSHVTWLPCYKSRAA